MPKNLRNRGAKNTIFYLLAIAATALLFSTLPGCKGSDERPHPDVSDIAVNLEFDRFEVALFDSDTNQPNEAYAKLRSNFPEFTECYFRNVIGLESEEDTSITRKLRQVLGYGGLQACYDSVMNHYPDVDWLASDLNMAFRYSNHYFPQLPIPKVRTFISEYGYGAAMCSDSLLGIGLDLFLGSHFEFYPQLNFPAYMIQRMERPYILPSALQVYIENFLSAPGSGGRLIDHMAYHGKVLYYLERVLPDVADSILIGYTKDQMDWCKSSESEVWAYFLDKERLFESNRLKFNYLVNEGPSTQGMPPESPGKIGRWVGWQIVRAYMNNNTGITMNELFREQRGQTILEMSGYRP